MNKISSRLVGCLVLVLGLLSHPGLVAQPAQWSPVLEVVTLADMLGLPSVDITPDSVAVTGATPVRVIHVTGDAAAGLIPGAVFVPYAEFRGPADNAGQLPSLMKLQEIVQRLGIEAHTPVVIVHQGSTASDFGAATRVYWTLKSLGVQQLAVLDGGFQQWLAVGLPVSQQSAPIEASGFMPVWNDTWRISTQQVEQALGDGSFNLIDSRPVNFYNGQQAVAARPGTIMGAANLAFDTWFDGSRLKPTAQLQHVLASSAVVSESSVSNALANNSLAFQEQGFTPTTVTFCNTGHWASINWFMLSEVLGIPDTRLYAESVVEWARQPRAMDNQPGRISWYWQMTRNWLSQITGY